MKKITLLAALGFILTGCDWLGIRGNGQITTDQRTTEAFSEIEANGAFQIEWRNGPPSVSITTDQNLLRYIYTQNVDHRLWLHSARNLWPTHRINVVVSSPTRTAAKLTGATRLTGRRLSGAKFAVQSSGAATVTVDGAVDELFADMTGASELKAESLRSKITQLSLTGAADADVNVSDTLKVSITGAGKLTYTGNPTIEKHVTGAGSMRRRE
jgi:hypothetical protein